MSNPITIEGTYNGKIKVIKAYDSEYNKELYNAFVRGESNVLKKPYTAKKSAKAPTLKSSVSMLSAENRVLTIKNIKASQVKSLTVRSSDTKKIKAKKKGKTKVNIRTAVRSKGSGTVTVTLKLKKAINGKKTYKFKVKVNIKYDEGEG